MTAGFETTRRGLLARAFARLHRAGIADDLAGRERLERLILASDFALDTLVRQPTLAAELDAPAMPPPVLAPERESDWPGLLRRWRAAESTRLVWRDVQGLDSVEDTLAGSSRIAEQALQAGMAAVVESLRARHGLVRDADGRVQTMVVFALGKLGGGELNFSSDVDLVYAFTGHGQSDGARPLDAEAWFTRAGQRLAQLLGEVTVDGFCHRVDLRLRPFGASGRIALSFPAMEQYYQREGRDWERYAWIKARPVAGDRVAGERLLETLQPFVYRRYLDYTALDGLREMKAMVDAEVQKRELAEHLKLGPGGIREIEFLVQAMQLIRAGREPELRQRALLPALQALAEAGHLPAATAEALAQAYRFLRRLENRVQMLGDQQTHALPDATFARERIARVLDFADAEALQVELDRHRAQVSEAFEGLLQARRRRVLPTVLAQYWRGLPDQGDATVLAEAGFAEAEAHHVRLRDFARSPAVHALSERARQRLDHVLPALIEATSHSSAADAALSRGLSLMQAIARRASYLALLEEQPAALNRLVDVTARSALMSERLAAHPLLLDELLDTRAAGPVPDVAAIREQMRRFAVALPRDDTEAALVALNEQRQSLSFRIALATLAQRQPPTDSASQLAALAEASLAVVLDLALAEMRMAHGEVPEVGFAVIGYGSLGGHELGFGSDLDLVFLHDARGEAVSDGPRPLEAARYFARLAQKLVSLLGTVTAAGRLYEADVRLRPDGAKGLLVSSLDSFEDYQRDRAWTWEQQALVRARACAGDVRVREGFERIRREVLQRPRDPEKLSVEVIAMRRRMREELDRSDRLRFDLKQGQGGLVDLEFLLQAIVLRHAAMFPLLCQTTRTPELIACLVAAGIVSGERGDALLAAHSTLLARGLDCTLDRRPRLCPEDPTIAQARAAIGDASRNLGLDFNAD
jgi:glutamate-ammonia-ligase adenylyltransferase